MKFIYIIFYPILFFLEFIYRAVFHCAICFRRRKQQADIFPFKIIGVGNLSVGGTGKSVFIGFLVRFFKSNVAIVLRGYKGLCSSKYYSMLVSKGEQILVLPSCAGDEATMHVLRSHVPVCIGKDRYKSCKLLEQHIYKKEIQASYVLLDDAYQHFSVKKDVEILLIDARAPFDNGHCLPCGLLREKDYSRADMIIATHADQVDVAQLQLIKTKLFKKIPEDKIFFGKHVMEGFYLNNEQKEDIQKFIKKSFMLVAGVGNFASVALSMKMCGINIAVEKKLNNHHVYTREEIEAFCVDSTKNNLFGVITTEKDWVKIQEFKKNIHVPFYVARVGFEFLNPREYDRFTYLMQVLLK